MFDVRSHSRFDLSSFGPFRRSVIRCSVIFDIQSFDVRSLSRFGLSTFCLSTLSPIRRSVFQRSVPFEVRSFDVRSFSMFGHSRFGRSTFSLSRFGLSRFGHSRFGPGFLLPMNHSCSLKATTAPLEPPPLLCLVLSHSYCLVLTTLMPNNCSLHIA
jgi:hypothetical protein